MWVGVWFGSRLYYPFGKGPGQHIIRYLENKKCENERTKKPTGEFESVNRLSSDSGRDIDEVKRAGGVVKTGETNSFLRRRNQT